MNVTPEDTLLCALLTCDATQGIDVAATIVTADDFIQDYNRKVWRAMVEVVRKGLVIDCCCLTEQLMTDGLSEDDAVNLLTRTLDGAPLAGYVEMYAKKVKEASRKHRIHKAIELANTRLMEGEDQVWVKTELEEAINQIEMVRRNVEDHVLNDIVPKTLESIRDKACGDESKNGLTTGIGGLDLLTTGINRGELWIVGGMPGRGKTAFGLQVAQHLVENGESVYLISLEMSESAVVRRMLKMKFGGAVIENPGKRWDEVSAYADELRTLPLCINDSTSLDVHEIVSRARLCIQRRKVRLVIVDYLQLIKAEGRDRRDVVGEATNQLRNLAKDTGVPVMAMSQLRRPHNINDRPTMIDLKETGDIEAHAHVVLLMYMPLAQGGGFSGEEEIIIGKQREGPTGSVPVMFEGSRAKFWERE